MEEVGEQAYRTCIGVIVSSKSLLVLQIVSLRINYNERMTDFLPHAYTYTCSLPQKRRGVSELVNAWVCFGVLL